MECLIGIQCKDFVLVAADMTTTQSIIVMKSGKCLYCTFYIAMKSFLLMIHTRTHISKTHYHHVISCCHMTK